MTTSLQIIRPTGPRIKRTKTPEVELKTKLVARPVTAKASEVKRISVADGINNGIDTVSTYVARLFVRETFLLIG